MATALAPLVLGGYIALGPLLASPCEGLMEGGKAADFAVVAIKQVRLANLRLVLVSRRHEMSVQHSSRSPLHLVRALG